MDLVAKLNQKPIEIKDLKKVQLVQNDNHQNEIFYFLEEIYDL